MTEEWASFREVYPNSVEPVGVFIKTPAAEIPSDGTTAEVPEAEAPPTEVLQTKAPPDKAAA